jgi:hypothetical protein
MYKEQVKRKEQGNGGGGGSSATAAAMAAPKPDPQQQDTRYLSTIEDASAREWWRTVVGARQVGAAGFEDALVSWLEGSGGVSGAESERLVQVVAGTIDRDGDGKISTFEFDRFVRAQMEADWSLGGLQAAAARIEVAAEKAVELERQRAMEERAQRARAAAAAAEAVNLPTPPPPSLSSGRGTSLLSRLVAAEPRCV